MYSSIWLLLCDILEKLKLYGRIRVGDEFNHKGIVGGNLEILLTVLYLYFVSNCTNLYVRTYKLYTKS